MNRSIDSSRTRVLPYNQILKSIAVHYGLQHRNIQLANSANKINAEKLDAMDETVHFRNTRKMASVPFFSFSFSLSPFLFSY